MNEALIWILFACLVAHASLSLQVNVNDEPSFVMTANEVTTVEGETAVLPCSILNLNDHKVAWTNKRSALLTMLDRRIIDDKRISLEQPTRNDWNIHIRNVLVSDEGRYTCHINTYPVKTHQVTLTVKGRWRRKEDEKLTDRPLTVSNETIVVEIQEYILKVNVNDEASFVMTASEVITVVGETAVLPCSILNLNDHKVVWIDKMSTLLTFQDRMIIDDKRISLKRPTPNDWNIHISDVQVSDEGRYSCQINTNPVKTHQVTLTVKVKVNDEPSFAMTANEVTTVEGETAVLPCSILNLNDHKVVWTDKMSTLLTFQDRMIIDDKRISLKRPTPNDWNIHISDVQVSDEGRYSCQINTNPVKTHQVTLTVKGPPIFQAASKYEVVTEGDYVQLWCNFTGKPKPTIAWFREDKRSRLRKQVGDENLLEMVNVTREEDGRYECVADNGIPPNVAKIMYIGVNYPPRIMAASKYEVIGEGTNVKLWCNVTSRPKSRITWFKKDESTKLRKQIGNGSMLELFHVTREEDGRYECVVENDIPPSAMKIMYVNVMYDDEQITATDSSKGQLITTANPEIEMFGTQTLAINGPPKALAASNYELVEEGSNVKLWCNVTGLPIPTITWFREDKNTKIRKRDQVGHGNLLEMVHVTREEDGRYRCVADNGIPPEVTKIMDLVVTYPPRIIAASRYKVVGEGANVKLWCNVTGRPTASVTWYKVDESTKTRKKRGYGNVLELLSVTREEDGRYECVAENGIAPNVMKILYIRIIYEEKTIKATTSSKGQFITTANPDKEMFGPPTFLAASRYEVVKEGKYVKLWCNFTGLPQPTITWYREDKSTRERKHVGDGNVLEIFNVTREEDGGYECVADNGIPPNVTRIMFVSVKYKPKILKVARKLSQQPGQDIILECQVVASPFKTILWKKDGQNITTDEKYSFDRERESRYSRLLRLHIINIHKDDFGVYTCYANNNLGSDQASITLTESNNQENGTTLTVTTSNEGILSSTTNRGKITVGKHTLDVNGPPIFLAASKYEVVTEGDYVQLWCNFTGNPKPSIAWFREDKRSRLRKQVGDGNLLEMANVTREEDGRYECVAENGIPPTVTKIMYIGVNYPPRILFASKYEVVEEGNNVQLWCNVTSRPKSRTTWFKKDERTKLKTQVGNGSMLELFHVTREEDGRYECVVENDIPPSAMKIMYVRVIYKDEIITATDSSKGQLNTTANPEIEMFSTQTLAINGPPKALAASNYELVKEGSNVQLWCNVTGLPIPTITWFREDKNTKIRKLDQVGHGNLLEMVQVTREEGGRYRCVADNGIPPEVTKIMYLVVTYPPRIIAASRYIVVGDGANVKLWCNVTGRPTASVTWYKVDESTKTRKKLGYGNVLELLSVTREADGSYECVAENGIAPNVMKILYIRIIYEEKAITATTSSKGQFITTANPDKEMFGPPRFLAASKYEVVREGKYVKLWCNFTGLPTPTITWFREDKTTRERKYVGDGNVLEIFNVTREEDGGYECVADNGIPPHISRIMFVSVKYKPEVSKIAIALSPTPEQIRILECQVVASPIKTILWKKDGRELTTNNKYKLELVRKSRYSRLLRLSISDIQKYDFGVYTCFANNKFGTDQANITLKDKDDDNEVNNDCENDCADEDAIDNDNDKDDDDEVNYDCENDCADENAIDNDNDKDDDNEVDDDCENDCVDEDAIDNENVDNDFVDDGDDDDLDNDVDALIDVDDADSYAYFEDAVDNY